MGDLPERIGWKKGELDRGRMGARPNHKISLSNYKFLPIWGQKNSLLWIKSAYLVIKQLI